MNVENYRAKLSGWRRAGGAATLLVVLLLAMAASVGAREAPEELEAVLGRSEVRVLGAPFPISPGLTVQGMALPERLEVRGYRRVHGLPERPGEYFWGTDLFWIYRRPHRVDGQFFPAALFGLELEDRGWVSAALTAGRTSVPLTRGSLWLEPEVLSESLAGDRAIRRPVALTQLPDRVWRAVLAAEDHRFFEHSGVSARAVARALLENLREGGVVQGGSTITQQLIKNRDLTPRRTLGRKVSEAVRALALETEYEKEEILDAYLDHVYLGHRDGLAIHGIGAAAEAYFGTGAESLSLAEAAMLAGMIQSPNRTAPDRHPERARARRDRVLARMEELGWASEEAVERALATAPRLRPGRPEAPPARHFLGWVASEVRGEAGRRLERGRGLIVESSLDPMLQSWAEEALAEGLDRIRRTTGHTDVSGALVSLDVLHGDVLAYVGGHPADTPPGFDRVRQARRQPGSLVKPLLLLEAFEECGAREPLYPARRVADRPLRIEAPGGPWEPRNSDGGFAGEITLREALVESRNIPFVRVARWCGWQPIANRLETLGLALPEDPPPSLALGAIEQSPLAMAEAYTALAALGEVVSPRPWRRLEEPDGDRLATSGAARRRVATPGAAYLVADLMAGAARDGTARAAQIPGHVVFAKTGTSSERRDAWLAGFAEGIVTVVWIGRDGGAPLGLTGSEAAAPVFRHFMSRAIPSRGGEALGRPDEIVTRWVDARTGLLVRERNPRAVEELFREGALPTRDRWWRDDEPLEVVE